MPDGVVIDTNIMSKFNKEGFFNTPGELCKLIDDILNSYHIALSELLYYEWKATCNSQPFKYWLDNNMLSQKIESVNPSIDENIMKKIHNVFGLPRKGKDKELIKIANVTLIKYILTEDIDLFDPKEKLSSAKRKEEIKSKRIGQLNKYLKKELNITVGLYSHCRNDLF